MCTYVQQCCTLTFIVDCISIMIMIEVILGNRIKEQVLLYIYTHKEGHIREISSVFGKHPNTFMRQLRKLEQGGVLVSRKKGRTKVYTFNLRYPFINELNRLMEKVLMFMPDQDKHKYYMPRLRPRRPGKPL